MTQEKDVNIFIGKFIGHDPDTLRNMGKVCLAFQQDVAELLENAIVHVIHVNRMRVMEEFLDFVYGVPPQMDNDLREKVHKFRWMVQSSDTKIYARYRSKYNLWAIVNINMRR
jgi:hypothetical protein